MKRLVKFFVVVLIISVCLIYQAVLGADTIPVKKGTLEYIELSSYNWEAVGKNIRIVKDGSFIISYSRASFSKIERRGKIDLSDLQELIKLFEDTKLYSLENEYRGPKKTSKLWINYVLTIRTDVDFKSVKFHSEDETAPKILKEIIDKVYLLTK